jgi:hypothetical protein
MAVGGPDPRVDERARWAVALTEELQATQRDAVPKRFEQAVAKALAALGLAAVPVAEGELLVQGPGEPTPTNFLLATPTSPTGQLRRQDVRWQALAARRQEVDARFVAVVGEGFERGLREWAAEDRHMRLLNTRALASLLRRHLDAPLTVDEIWENFSTDPEEAHRAEEERLHRVQEAARAADLAAAAEASAVADIPELPGSTPPDALPEWAGAIEPPPAEHRASAIPAPTRPKPPPKPKDEKERRSRRRSALLFLLMLLLLLLCLFWLVRCFPSPPMVTPTVGATVVVSQGAVSPTPAAGQVPPATPPPAAAAVTPTAAALAGTRRCAVELVVPRLSGQQQYVVRFAQARQADVVALWSAKGGEVELYGGTSTAPLKIAASADAAGSPEAVVVASGAPGEYVARLRNLSTAPMEPSRLGLFYDEMSTCEIDPSTAVETSRVTPVAATPTVPPEKPAQPPTPAARPTPSGREAVVLIVDLSASMFEEINGREKLQQQRSALRTLVDELPDRLPLGVRFFGHRAAASNIPQSCTDVELVHPVAPPDKRKLRRLIDSANARGRTPLTKALADAKADFPAGLQSGTVILLTDGEESCGGDPVAAAADLRRHRPPVTVHVIGFTDEPDVSQHLSQVGAAGGGRYKNVVDAATLKAALDEIIAEVR